MFRRLEQCLRETESAIGTALCSSYRPCALRVQTNESYHNCSCGTRTLEKLTQYRSWIWTVPTEGLSWRSVGTATLFLRPHRPVSIIEKCDTIKLLQANNFTNVAGITYLLTAWSRVLLEKLTGSQLVKKFPTYYGTPRFTTAFLAARHLSHPEPARSRPYPHIPLLEDLSLYYPPICAWVSRVVSFPQDSPPKPCICLSSPPYVLHSPLVSFFSILSPEQYWVRNTSH